MGAGGELLRVIGPELRLLLPELDEKARRLTLGAVARAAGDGGIGAVARLTGASWQTVANGAAELGSGQVAAGGCAGRARGARSWPRPARAWCRRCWPWWGTPAGGIRARRCCGRPRVGPG